MNAVARTFDTQWLGIADPARMEAFERALTVAGAGQVLLQTFINRVVQQLTLREFGAQAVIPRRPGSGDAAYINRRAPGSTSAEWVIDTDSPTEDTGTYTQASFPYRCLLTQGKVTRKTQAQGASYGDALGLEVAAKTDDFVDVFESALIVGDNNANAKQPDGLLTLINAVSGQVVSQTTAAAGDDLTVAALDEVIDLVKGSAVRSDLAILGSFAGMRKLNSALQAQQRFTNVTEIAAGFRVRTYDGVPMIITTGMPNVLTWNGTAGSITAFSGGATTALAVINMRYWWIEELTRMSVLPLAKTSSQFDNFDIYWDGSLAQANTVGGALLGGIKPT